MNMNILKNIDELEIVTKLDDLSLNYCEDFDAEEREVLNCADEINDVELTLYYNCYNVKRIFEDKVYLVFADIEERNNDYKFKESTLLLVLRNKKNELVLCDDFVEIVFNDSAIDKCELAKINEAYKCYDTFCAIMYYYYLLDNYSLLTSKDLYFNVIDTKNSRVNDNLDKIVKLYFDIFKKKYQK